MSVKLDDFISDPDMPDPPSELWPNPLLWRILVRPYVYRKKTPRGVIIPDPVADAQALQNVTAKLLRLGPHCFRDHQTGKPWEPAPDVREGDTILIAKFAGQKVTINDVHMYILNCEDITGVLPRK